MEVSTGNIATGPADMMAQILNRGDENLPFKGQGFYCFKQRTVLVTKEPTPPQAEALGATTEYFKAYQYRVPFNETIFNTTAKAWPEAEFPIYNVPDEPAK